MATILNRQLFQKNKAHTSSILSLSTPLLRPCRSLYRFRLRCATGTAAGSFQADVRGGGAVQDQQGCAGAGAGGGPAHHAHLVQPQLAGARASP